MRIKITYEWIQSTDPGDFADYYKTGNLEEVLDAIRKECSIMPVTVLDSSLSYEHQEETFKVKVEYIDDEY